MSSQLLLDILKTPKQTFKNYIVGKNSEALSAIKNISSGRAIYLWGPSGSGRTHLLKAIQHETNGIYFNHISKIDSIKNILENENNQNFSKFILIDNVHLFDKTRQSLLFTLYNKWREIATTTNAFTITLSGNLSPMFMHVREDIRTRLGWDLIFRLEPLSDSDKYTALKTQAEERGLKNIDNVLQWMLNHYERDIRKQIIVLDALDRYSLETRKPITISLLRNMLLSQGIYLL
ncbi:DnaA regulatory inactivator Hda [Candidatus Kinetoplastibacterium sorsogonicusi]|uniref:DnaA regulatory inactivator Hda n=1 Tax=Candidatus Kinetoplastidibacterium kentomonadis TaxID=1576550 RepID=A0A3Q8F3V9_9PROT|nr:DnaA/Hda family protein [Candidatus Kinetoplastibacterium sorsogonicusi]AWD32646.1 DnaA regulatory inactivator Hda [Candidatus Kinetoplastibacterium sorsogonicusi]